MSTSIDFYRTQNIYVAGQTASSDFPITPNVFDTSKSGYSDAFLVKRSGDLTNLIASTYLSGYYKDIARNSTIVHHGFARD